MSLGKVREATAQTRIVINGIVQPLLARPPERRPRFLLSGQSLGYQVSQEIFEGQEISGPAAIGLDAAVWIGTPAATVWREEIDNPTMRTTPAVQEGVLVTRGNRDWTALSESERSSVRYLLLQNGDDPIPKFEAALLWRRPAWLGPDHTRPLGAPRGTRWLPVTTFFSTFVDLQNALAPTPGKFCQGGHDYRLLMPETLRTVFRLGATEQRMARVQHALRARELGREAKRRWAATEAMPADEHSATRAIIVQKVSEWTGRTATDADVQAIIAADPGE